MRPGLRKLALTTHVIASVGWLGAVAAFLALAVTVLASDEPETVRAAYVAMDAMGWFVLVPLSLASLTTGLVQALGTPWGLFRQYWVVFKLLINLMATLLLLAYTSTLDALARDAVEITPVPRSPSPVLHASAAIVLLLVATTLAIYKPRGVTPYGRRRGAR